VNRLHRALPPEHKRRFFHAFLDCAAGVEGTWRVDFAGRPILLPLHRDFAFSWTAALGFHGYDPALHAFYEALVQGPRPPRTVFDVGANYGAHSIRFLVHGARTVSFEPNAACHPWFREWCALNGVRPEIRPVAVGPGPGEVELAVPGGALHLGTTTAAARARWDGRDVRVVTVPQVSLDDVVAGEGAVPDLVKIDVEGGELGVLRGARRLLDRGRPVVVLESWRRSPDRPALAALLAAAGYRLSAVAWGPPAPAGGAAGEPLDAAAFVTSPAENFVAWPREGGGLPTAGGPSRHRQHDTR
jgi:FkbM family methyltransferase